MTRKLWFVGMLGTVALASPTWGEKESTTEMRPRVISKGKGKASPPTTARKPTTTARKPPTTARKPPTTARRPPTTARKPPPTARRPTTTATKPPTTTPAVETREDRATTTTPAAGPDAGVADTAAERRRRRPPRTTRGRATTTAPDAGVAEAVRAGDALMRRSAEILRAAREAAERAAIERRLDAGRADMESVRRAAERYHRERYGDGGARDDEGRVMEALRRSDAGVSGAARTRAGQMIIDAATRREIERRLEVFRLTAEWIVTFHEKQWISDDAALSEDSRRLRPTMTATGGGLLGSGSDSSILEGYRIGANQAAGIVRIAESVMKFTAKCVLAFLLGGPQGALIFVGGEVADAIGLDRVITDAALGPILSKYARESGIDISSDEILLVVDIVRNAANPVGLAESAAEYFFGKLVDRLPRGGTPSGGAGTFNALRGRLTDRQREQYKYMLMDETRIRVYLRTRQPPISADRSSEISRAAQRMISRRRR